MYVFDNLYDILHYNAFYSQIKANTPILMCSVPGYDASGRIDDLAAEINKPLTSIAIGEFRMQKKRIIWLNAMTSVGQVTLSSANFQTMVSRLYILEYFINERLQ